MLLIITIETGTFFFSFLFLKFIYLIYQFLAALGLCCPCKKKESTRAFYSCGKWGLLFVAVRGLLIAVASPVAELRLQARGLQQLWLAGSRAQAQQLWCTGLVAPRYVGSSQNRARTRVPCIGRWILNHCATREARNWNFLDLQKSSTYFKNPVL